VLNIEKASSFPWEDNFYTISIFEKQKISYSAWSSISFAAAVRSQIQLVFVRSPV